MKQLCDHAAGRTSPVGFNGGQLGRQDLVVGGDNLLLLR